MSDYDYNDPNRDEFEGAINQEQEAEDRRSFQNFDPRTADRRQGMATPPPDSIEEQQYGIQQDAQQGVPPPVVRADGTVDLGPYRQPTIAPIQFTPRSQSEKLIKDAKREGVQDTILRNVATLFAVNRRIGVSVIGCLGVTLVISICFILYFLIRLVRGG